MYKRIFRVLWEKKGPFIGAFFLVFLSTMLYVCFQLLSARLSNSYYTYIHLNKQEHLHFRSLSPIKKIGAIANKFNLEIELQPSLDVKSDSNKHIRLFTIHQKINIPALIDGDSFDVNGIWTDPLYARANHLQKGQAFNINGKSYTYRGCITLPNYAYIVERSNDLFNNARQFGIAICSDSIFNSLINSNSFEYAVIQRNASTLSHTLLDSFKNELIKDSAQLLSWNYVDEGIRTSGVSEKIAGIERMGGSFPYFILVLSCIITMIVMNRYLKSERMQIGTLYALGFTKLELLQHYLCFPLIIGSAGALVGAYTGYLIVTPFMQVMLSYFPMPVVTSFPSSEIIIKGIIIPFVLILLSVGIQIWFQLRQKPLTLMRIQNSSYQVNRVFGFLIKQFPLKHRPFIRESFRNFTRNILLTIGVLIATILLLYGFVMKSSLDNLFNKQIQSTFLYNYEYILQSPITDSLTPNLEPASSVPFTLIPDAKHKIQLLGLASNQTLVSLKDDADKKLNCNSESDFIITRSMASSLGIKVGDAIVLKNLINNKILKKQVSGIAESYVGNFAFLNISELNTNLGWPSNSYNIIHCKDSLVKVPGSLFEKRNMREQSASFKEILKPLTIEISAISIIAFLIGLIVIYIISGISIEENTNTITLYKVFGYTAKEINSIVLSSMRWYVIGGFAIGVPLTLFSVHLFIDKAMEKLNILMPTEINYIDIVWAFLILYASFLLTKQINIKKINKMNPAEILKNRIE